MLTRVKRSVAWRLRRFGEHRQARALAQLERDRGVPEGSTALDLKRAEALAAVDVTQHNAGSAPPGFTEVVSQVVSAAQFEHPEFQRLARLLTGSDASLPWRLDRWPLGQVERKLWEWCYILRVAEQHGKLGPGVDALGFGVGTEPLPAALASFGLRVLATDLDPVASEVWAKTDQHMGGLAALSRPHILPDDELSRQVRMRYVDMNDVPDDLGTFDLLWSSCAFEHLGTPEAGLDFVVQTVDHLRPGGVAVHTTELELTRRDSTADYGHLAVYRLEDLESLRTRVRAGGHDMQANWYVALETFADRWICLPPYQAEDRFHLKLLLGESSVSTSVGIVISRSGGADSSS